jgi:hypothetical protein
MKALTQDENILRQALVDSHITIVDNKIKANIKSTGRSTIILREIPSDAPIEEVKEIFNYPGCKPTSSIRSEIGDTWFVNMDSEEDAKDTLLDLRLKKRTFRGQSVKGRLKTETVVRSFYPVQAGVPQAAPVYPVMPFGAAGMMGPGGMPMPLPMGYGYMGMPPVSMMAGPGAVGGADLSAQGGDGSAAGGGDAAAGAAVATAPAQGAAADKTASNKSGAHANNNNSSSNSPAGANGAGNKNGKVR